MTMMMTLPGAKYQDENERRLFAEAAVSRIEALPEVQSAFVSGGMPLMGGGGKNLTRVGEQDSGARPRIATYRPIWPGYFGTLEVPLRSGRTFTAQDIEGSAPVVIVNEALVREHFPGTNPIGERIVLADLARPGGGPDRCLPMPPRRRRARSSAWSLT